MKQDPTAPDTRSRQTGCVQTYMVDYLLRYATGNNSKGKGKSLSFKICLAKAFRSACSDATRNDTAKPVRI